MKTLFALLILIATLNCSSSKTESQRTVIIEGIYDHAEYVGGDQGYVTIIHLEDGRAVSMKWQHLITCKTGDSIVIYDTGHGANWERKIAITEEK